jgi:hypothetical protein
VQWTLPPQILCGGANEPTCPELNARLLIDALVPEGTAFQNTATATDQDGFVISGPQLTTVARFLVQALVLAYPVNADSRDRVNYRAKFGLLATESIVPGQRGVPLQHQHGQRHPRRVRGARRASSPRAASTSGRTSRPRAGCPA